MSVNSLCDSDPGLPIIVTHIHVFGNFTFFRDVLLYYNVVMQRHKMLILEMEGPCNK